MAAHDDANQLIKTIEVFTFDIVSRVVPGGVLIAAWYILWYASGYREKVNVVKALSEIWPDSVYGAAGYALLGWLVCLALGPFARILEGLYLTRLRKTTLKKDWGAMFETVMGQGVLHEHPLKSNEGLRNFLGRSRVYLREFTTKVDTELPKLDGEAHALHVSTVGLVVLLISDVGLWWHFFPKPPDAVAQPMCFMLIAVLMLLYSGYRRTRSSLERHLHLFLPHYDMTFPRFGGHMKKPCYIGIRRCPNVKRSKSSSV
ncbi:MAG: hypothetical protein ABIE70_10795 [bacterium]